VDAGSTHAREVDFAGRRAQGESTPYRQQRICTQRRERRGLGTDQRLTLGGIHALAALLELAQNFGGGTEDAVRGQSLGQVRGDLFHFGVGLLGQQQRARLEQQQLAPNHQKVGQQVG